MIAAVICWAVPVAALGMCGAYTLPRLRSHRPGCLRRTVGIYALIIATRAAIAAVTAWRAARHPAWHLRYLAARAIRRIPRRDPDGELLDPDETRVLIEVIRNWHASAPAERSRT